MKHLFNIFTNLIEIIKIMHYKTRKSINEALLKYFYIEIEFTKPTKKYKLPLIVQVKDRDEAIRLRTNIIEQLIKEGFMIEDMKIKSKFKSEIPTKEEELNQMFKDKEFVTIDLIFEKSDNDSMALKPEVKRDTLTYKANIVSKDTTPFKHIGSLVALTIDESKL